MAKISSITKVGKTEPFELQVARGQISWHYPQFKFGFNPDVDNALETVWAEGGLYGYLSAASVLKVSSSSTDDAAAGTGARTVQLYGLDADYNEINEIVTLNGQTSVNSVNSFLRINRMVIRSAGSGEINSGVVYAGTGAVTSGVPDNKYATIAVGDGQTLMALWTVPAGYTAYLFQTHVTAACTTSNKLLTATIVARPFGEVFQVKDKFGIQIDGGDINQIYHFPIKFDEKTDIEVRAISDAGSANAEVSAGLDIIYIKNDGAT
tara:strand:- start:178 stop:972 length:795 start_codon:yes stop_codon:yes gene_type:complete